MTSVALNENYGGSNFVTPIKAEGVSSSPVDQTVGTIAKLPLKENSREVSPSWDQRAIAKIDQFENTTIERIPNVFNTKLLDGAAIRATNFLNKITLELAPIKTLNEWLNKDELRRDNWNSALDAICIFLAKLPLRAARNILSMVLNIVKMAVYSTVYTIVHPAKAAMKLARMLVRLLKELSKPETWAKVGAGIIGASLGQAAMGNVIAPLAMIIGGSMMCAGILGRFIVTLLDKNKDHRDLGLDVNNLLKQIPEAFLTGFLTGLLFVPVQKEWNTLNQQKDLWTARRDFYHWWGEWDPVSNGELAKIQYHLIPPDFVIQNGAYIATSAMNTTGSLSQP